MKCNECNRVKYNQILIWLCVLSFFSVLNEMVLNVSLPDIANDFNKPPASTNWVNTAFMLTFSIGTAVYGKLSDQLGIKRLLLFGIIINCFGSVIGFVGHSFFSLLIMARFIQGAGAAAFPALVMVVVARYIPKENRGKAFGLIGSIVAMGEGVGPAIGGMIAHAKPLSCANVANVTQPSQYIYLFFPISTKYKYTDKIPQR